MAARSVLVMLALSCAAACGSSGISPAAQAAVADMHAGVERAVALKQPLPVYLTYFTAWEEHGDLKIGDDVYGYDAKQRSAGP